MIRVRKVMSTTGVIHTITREQGVSMADRTDCGRSLVGWEIVPGDGPPSTCERCPQ